MKKTLLRCTQCNKEFFGYNETTRFCSKACYGQSLMHRDTIICPTCGKLVTVRFGRKFCSRPCADAARRGVILRKITYGTCPVCNKSFEIRGKQKFCSRQCAAIGMNRPKHHNISEQGKQAQSENLKKLWQNPDFSAKVVERMRTDNPSHNPEVLKRMKTTRLQNRSYVNNFKYGNGKISEYEQLVYNKLEPLGFIYNYPIGLKDIRAKYPDRHYPTNYKPDFIHLDYKLCIEIDGCNHIGKDAELRDLKKTQCLELLGYTTIRFTHKDIDKGVFDEWLNSFQKKL